MIHTYDKMCTPHCLLINNRIAQTLQRLYSNIELIDFTYFLYYIINMLNVDLEQYYIMSFDDILIYKTIGVAVYREHILVYSRTDITIIFFKPMHL